MEHRIIVSVLAAAAIYIAVAAVFGAGIKTIATQVPAGQTDPQFAPVVCSLAVACPHAGQLRGVDSIDRGGFRAVADTK